MTAVTEVAAPHGTQFVVHVPAKPGRGDKLTDIGPKDAERIAIGLSEVLREADIRAGRPPRPRLHTDWVEITKLPEAGSYLITVVDRDVMAQVRAFRDTPGWGDFRDPMRAGWRLEGIPHHLRLDQHGQLIGMSTSGKSSLIQCCIAHGTRCRTAVVWVGGVQKLYDLVAGWVEPLVGSGHHCPIDWIASGAEDTLAMMAAAMRVARFRQGIRMAERGNWPAILLILDEVSFLLEQHGTFVRVDGAPFYADALAADIVRGATSGDVFAQFATQHDVHACFGDKGGTLQAQMSYTGMFKIRDNDAIGRQLKNWELKMPTHRGEYWLDDGEGFPFRLKAEYIQTIDPSKPRLHTGATIADITWARAELRTHHRHGLDERSAMVAGEAYQRRRTIVDDGYIAYLTGAPAQIATVTPVMSEPGTGSDGQDEGGGEGPGDRELRDAEADLAERLTALRNVGEELPEDMAGFLENYTARSGATAGSAPQVPSMVGRVSRKDRVQEIIREFGPLGRAEIVTKLHEQGDPRATGQIVTNILTELVASGEYRRDDESRYQAL